MPIISDNYPMKGLFQCPRAERGSFFLASHNGQGRKETEKGTSEDIQRIGKAFKEAK